MKHLKNRIAEQLETWSSGQLQDQIQSVSRFVIIPLGSFEQHGPHAPLGTDNFICQEVCQRLARALNGFTIPPVWYSVSEEHMDFAGTITISPETFCNYVSDIILSLALGGFTKILVLNGHGSNEAFFAPIRTKVKDKFTGELNLQLLSYWTALSNDEKDYLCSFQWGLHANAFETSVMLAIYPGLVKNISNCRNFPNVTELNPGDLDAKQFRNLIKGSNGVWGDPGQASSKKGRSLLASIDESLTQYVIKVFELAETV